MNSNIFIRNLIISFFSKNSIHQYNSKRKYWLFIGDSEFQDFMSDNINDMDNVAGQHFDGSILETVVFHNDGSIYVEYEEDGDSHWLKFHLSGSKVVYSYD